jgi:hypothetical protein
MWPKTFIGFLFGLLLSISLVLNLNLLLPLAEDIRLLTGLVLAFPIWAGVLVWAFAHQKARLAAKHLSFVFIPSCLLNAILLMS